MRISPLGARTRLFVVSLAMVSVGVSALALTDTRPVSVRAKDWAHENVGSLPATPEEMAAYPPAYRLAAFQELTPLQRSALVRAQFRAFENRWAVTPEQRDVLHAMAVIVEPEAYTEAGRLKATEKMKALCDRAQKVFSKDQLSWLTALGPTEYKESPVRRLAASVKRLVSSVTVHADEASVQQNCSCTNDSWCGFSCYFQGYICATGGCNPSAVGCGCGLIWPCDGFCYNPIPPGRP